MIATLVKWLMAIVLAGIVAGAARVTAMTSEGDPPAPPPRPDPAAKPQPLPTAWRLLMERDDARIAVNLSDGATRELPVSRGSFANPAGPPEAEQVTVSFVVSPDRKRMVYETTHPRLGRRNGMLATAEAGEHGYRPLTESKNNYNPVWSPDSKRIVFLSDRENGKWHLFSIDADAPKDNAVRVVDDEVRFDCRPCFAADGRLIYTIARPSQSKLPLMNLVIGDGKKKETIVEDDFVLSFNISPNGGSLAYVIPGALILRDLRSGKEQRVTVADANAKWRVSYSDVLWRRDSGALALTLSFLGGRTEGAKMPGEDHVAVVTLGSAKPSVRTYRIGEGYRLYGWATDEELESRRK